MDSAGSRRQKRLGERESAIRRAQFRLYGLGETFRGLRWVAEYDSAPSLVVLGHGDPFAADGALVNVGVLLRPPAPAVASVDIRDTLATKMAIGETGRVPEIELDVDWRDVVLLVDGEPEPFLSGAHGGSWVAFHEYPDRWVYVHARAADVTALVHVSPDEYLAGSRWLDANEPG